MLGLVQLTLASLAVTHAALLQIVVCCVVTQMNYLNKALDLFNAAIVSPVYYVMFTVLTILASIVMFRVRVARLRSTPFTRSLTWALVLRRMCRAGCRCSRRGQASSPL
jgi:hypothetical protein